jgi:hypothetical protein
MRIDIQYLAHYKGASAQAPAVRERVCWALASVEVETVPLHHLQLCLHDDRGYGADDAKVFAYDGDYWARVGSVNKARHGRERSHYHRSRADRPNSADIADFSSEEQRAFAWSTFEFALLARLPGNGVYSTETYNYTGYKPAGTIEWDDSAVIREKARRWYARNVIVADNQAFCRIEPPCVWTVKDRYSSTTDFEVMLTPSGGTGDPIKDFARGYSDALRIAEIRRGIGHGIRYGDGAAGSRHPFFLPIEGHVHRHDRRLVRACFTHLFRRRPWFQSETSLKGRPHVDKLRTLHALWDANWDNMTDDLLDEAAEGMLSLWGKKKPGGPVAKALERWLDRPIPVAF